jgi:hypothetical protein
MTSTSENLPAPVAPAKLASVAFGVGGVELRSIEDLYRFGKAVVESGLAPNAYKKPEQIMVAVQAGAEIGFGPMQSLQSFAVIGGKPTLMVEPALALVRRSGLLRNKSELWEGEGDERRCTVNLWREGERCERSFSMADAKRAGLAGKDVWRSYPDRMLYARAMGFALRDLFADVLRGIGITEEQRDIPEVRNVTPPRAAPTGPDPLLAQLGSGQAQTIDVESEEGGGDGPAGTQRVSAEASAGNSNASAGQALSPERLPGMGVGSGIEGTPAQSAGVESGASSDSPVEIPLGIRAAISTRASRLVDSKRVAGRMALESMVVDMLLAEIPHDEISKAALAWKPQP